MPPVRRNAQPISRRTSPAQRLSRCFVCFQLLVKRLLHLLSDDPYLGFEEMTRRLENPPLHQIDQADDLRRAGLSRLTIKLPCFSDTSASPMRVPLSPVASISLPAGIVRGFLKMDPAFLNSRGAFPS